MECHRRSCVSLNLHGSLSGHGFVKACLIGADCPGRRALILRARAHIRRRDPEAEAVLDAPLPHARQEHAPSPCGAEMPEDLETEGLEQRGQQAEAKLMREGAAQRR